MTILGFDTATASTAACLLRDDGESFEVEPSFGALSGAPAHARELMPAIAQVMERGRVSFDELEAIAVGVGPGSFTGLRIAVATARALAHASGAELRPVSSLAALAAGIGGPLRLPLIDAKRGELFAALYADGEELRAPFAARPEEVAACAAELASRPADAPPRPPAGTLSPVRAAGDGSVRFRSVLEAAGIEVEPDGSRAHVVRALHVCRLGAGAPARPLEAVLPEYLRLPDAKPRA
jgi:tRNA threonylcarbamoyladenosine biosynthesis protein TsaB